MLVETVPLDLVRRNALQVYPIKMTNWGVDVIPADGESFVSRAMNFGVTAIAISPDSTMTSVIVRPLGSLAGTSGEVSDGDMVVGKDSPMIGRFSFPAYGPLTGGWRLVCPTRYRADFYRSQEGNNASIGTVSQSSLSLIVYLDGQPPMAGSTRRFSLAGDLVLTTIQGGAQSTDLVLRTEGRRHGRVTAGYTTGIPGVGFTVYASPIIGLMEGPRIALPVPPSSAPQSLVLGADNMFPCDFVHLRIHEAVAQAGINAKVTYLFED